MHYILSTVTALLLLGCSGQTDNTEKTEAPSTTQKAVPTTSHSLPGVAQTAETVKEDGASLYKKCISCHGAKAEKAALGKSQIIAGWDMAQTEAALKGYKDGNYGGSMKNLMQGQVKTLNDEQITKLAEYINKL